MIERTKEEIEQKIIELINPSNNQKKLEELKDLYKLEIEISGNPKDWTIKISRMYEYINVNFKFLTELSNFFCTYNINDSRYNSRGCKTCNFGSSYEVTLYIKEDD